MGKVENMETFTTIFIAAGGWVVTLVVCVLQMNSASKKMEAENMAHLQEINRSQDKHMAELQSSQEKQMLEIQASFNQAVAVIDCRIQNLTDKVEKHNSVVERTFKLENDVSVLTEKVKVANNRILDIEKEKKE